MNIPCYAVSQNGLFARRTTGGVWIWVDSIEKAVVFFTYEGALQTSKLIGGIVVSSQYVTVQRDFDMKLGL